MTDSECPANNVVDEFEPTDSELRVYCHTDWPRLDIVRAPGTRDWMQRTPRAYAVSCRPLRNANEHGWFILNPHTVVAVWDGGRTPDSMHVRYLDGSPPYVPRSYFGEGILTFQTGLVFRTPPGIGLLFRGPANLPVHGASPIEGLVETDWTASPLAMHWMLTKPNEPVSFVKGQPFCMIVPIKLDVAESLHPIACSFEEDPEVENEAEILRSRNAGRMIGVTTGEYRWRSESYYLTGYTEMGEPVEDAHLKFRLRQFTDPE